MVLQTQKFKLHDSLRKTIKKFRNTAACEIRIDSAFPDVIRACAESPRSGQPGTWIVPQMQAAYGALHRAGFAHSVETWIHGELAGGLYCVSIGHAVFGESMFARQTDASKIALCALVALCRANNIAAIDCQQNTPHLASLGATEIPREEFLDIVSGASGLGALEWEFTPLYWQHILEKPTAACD
jgi:leucyl/phenylalanyl-tRNA--protein transferase